jgi:circadian clock protein KaiB
MATSKNTRTGTRKKAARQAQPPESRVAAKKRPAKRTVAALAEVEGEGDGSPDDVWTLRLYIAGDSPKSRTALANLERLCDAHLKGKYKIEVIDLKTRPELAKADQILALPTLIRKIPEPMKRLIGDLSNAERALVALDLEADPRLKGTNHAH